MTTDLKIQSALFLVGVRFLRAVLAGTVDFLGGPPLRFEWFGLYRVENEDPFRGIEGVLDDAVLRKMN